MQEAAEEAKKKRQGRGGATSMHTLRRGEQTRPHTMYIRYTVVE